MSTHSELASPEAMRSGPLIPRKAAFALSVVAGATAAAALFGFVGFVLFVTQLPIGRQATPHQGDGIVALTGGAERLSDALLLLASGRGKRLLISGVHPETTDRELSRAQPDYQAFARCCVDLGRRALNTAGNAVETRRWVDGHGFRSLIVVTSSYHMPRTLMELAREMPQVELIPYAVATDRAPWWRDWPTARLLASEYTKYVAALVRVRLAPRLSSPAPSTGEGSRAQAPGGGA